jgi:phosphopantothenoylcysteine decarboxylase / phosphopantothenate---cysteine ligase
MSKKNIVIGISGGIAVYKVCDLIRRLKDRGDAVHVIMTRHAQEFVTPLTFQTLSQNLVHTDNFELSQEKDIDHIALADTADVVVLAPATANIIGKISHGISDDLLTTVVCATRAPVVLAPAMNVNMWNNSITQENVTKLKTLGVHCVDPAEGDLACGYTGVGRLAETPEIIKVIDRALS